MVSYSVHESCFAAAYAASEGSTRVPLRRFWSSAQLGSPAAWAKTAGSAVVMPTAASVAVAPVRMNARRETM